MSTTFTTTRRRVTTAPATSRRQPTAPASLRVDTAPPTARPTSLPTSLDVEFSLLDSNIAVPTSSAIATDVLVGPQTTNAFNSVETCLPDNDCVADRKCNDGNCVGFNDAAPLGGPGSEPTSQLNTASAIGISIGVVAVIALLIGFGVWFWKARGRRPPNGTVEAPVTDRKRPASNATSWTADNDQKTLVASLPNSPHNARFREQHEMAPGLFAKALVSTENTTEQRSFDNVGEASPRANEKALPPSPRSENPLPPAPTEEKRYAVNVNINKSMIFDEDMIRAVSPICDSGTPRERAPRYRFEEYLPPVASTPPISITLKKPVSSKPSSEYELERFSTKRKSLETASTEDDGSHEDPKEATLLKLEGKAQLLPLPSLPPPSPSLSFRSYDWYQDIIRDSQNAERTPTDATFPRPLSLSSKSLAVDPKLVPGPLSPGGPHSKPVSTVPLSPTNSNYRLSPTVYQMPSISEKMPSVPPVPPELPTPPPKATRVSVLSTMTRKTHNSRSWLPEDGLYLPEEGTVDSWKKLRRPSDPSRPTSYSPLS